MDIACCYFYTQYESPAVTGSMGFIGKLPLMLTLYKHSAVRIGGGDGLFFRFAALGRLGIIVIVVIFNGLLAQLFALSIDLTAKLSGVDLGCLLHLFLLVLLFVGACLDMGTVNENGAGIDHAVIQCLVKNMLKNLRGQFVRKTLAEGIADRCKVRDFIQQAIAQKPPICQIYLDFTVCLAK